MTLEIKHQYSLNIVQIHAVFCWTIIIEQTVDNINYITPILGKIKINQELTETASD